MRQVGVEHLAEFVEDGLAAGFGEAFDAQRDRHEVGDDDGEAFGLARREGGGGVGEEGFDLGAAAEADGAFPAFVAGPFDEGGVDGVGGEEGGEGVEEGVGDGGGGVGGEIVAEAVEAGGEGVGEVGGEGLGEGGFGGEEEVEGADGGAGAGGDLGHGGGVVALFEEERRGGGEEAGDAVAAALTFWCSRRGCGC